MCRRTIGAAAPVAPSSGLSVYCTLFCHSERFTSVVKYASPPHNIGKAHLQIMSSKDLLPEADTPPAYNGGNDNHAAGVIIKGTGARSKHHFQAAQHFPGTGHPKCIN